MSLEFSGACSCTCILSHKILQIIFFCRLLYQILSVFIRKKHSSPPAVNFTLFFLHRNINMTLCMKKSVRRGKYQWLGVFFQVFKTNKLNFRVLEILHIACHVVYIQFKCAIIDKYGLFLCLLKFELFNRLHWYYFHLVHMHFHQYRR